MLPVMVVPAAWVEVVVMLVNAVLLPTVLLKLILPLPAVIVSARAPLIVLPNSTSLLVVVKVAFAPRVKLPVYVCVPVVVILPLRIVPELCVEVVSRLVNAALLPTVLLKVMLPVPAVMVNALAPLTVLLNEILFPADDAPVDAAVMELPRVTAPV